MAGGMLETYINRDARDENRRASRVRGLGRAL